MRKERICASSACSNLITNAGARGLCGKCYHKFCRLGILEDYPKHPPLERFWENTKINKITGCILWTRKLDKNGYGVLYFKDKIYFAHRISLILNKSIKIEKNQCVCHKCDNPSCVNPEHLFVGTQKDNIKDMINKGRKNQVQGEKHGKAKLTDEQVRFILDSNESAKELAIQFNVTDHTIYRIKRRETWQHLN